MKKTISIAVIVLMVLVPVCFAITSTNPKIPPSVPLSSSAASNLAGNRLPPGAVSAPPRGIMDPNLQKLLQQNSPLAKQLANAPKVDPKQLIDSVKPAKPKENDECTKEKLSQATKSGNTEGIKEFKEAVQNPKGNTKGVDVCGYDQGCKDMADEFKQKYDQCINKCQDNPKCVDAQGKKLPNHVEGPATPKSCTHTSVEVCKKAKQETSHCNKEASTPANQKGNQKVQQIQQPGGLPKGDLMTIMQGRDCADVVLKNVQQSPDQSLQDLQKLTPDQIDKLAKENPGAFSQIGEKFAGANGGLTPAQQAALGQNTKAAANWVEGVGKGGEHIKNFANFGEQNARAISNELIANNKPQLAPSNFGGQAPDSAFEPPQPDTASGPGGGPGGSGKSEAIQVAEINAASQKESAMIGAEASVKSASIGAAAQVASAAIGAAAQLAGQQGGGEQGGAGGTEVKAPDSGATAQLNEVPNGATASVTSGCVGVTAPTEAQIVACEKLGFKNNGGVLVPIDKVGVSNLNPPGGPNILTPIGGAPGTQVEQLVSTQPGATVETTIDPALGGSGVTITAVASPVRIRDVISEGVVIGDYRTNTILRYPAESTADKPLLINWFTGNAVFSAPPEWEPYQFQGLPKATINYQVGGADAPSAPNTVNIGQLNSNFIKIVPTIDDARIDFKADSSIITTLVQGGIFRGSSMMASLVDVAARAKKNYLLESLKGPSYVVTGAFVRNKDGGKIIQSSLPVDPKTISPQQCALVYGRPCR